MGEVDQTREDWPEAMAEVTECRYDVRAGRALAFGLTSDKHFRVTYSYRVGEELHTGEYFSRTARLQGSLFPIHYNPDSPHLSHSKSEAGRSNLILLIGATGLVSSALVLVLVLRGC